MTLLIIACAGLFLLSLILFFYVRALKKAMRTIKSELKNTRDFSYNRHITVSLFDNDLTEMTVTLNENIEYQKRLKLKAGQAGEIMQRAASDIAHDLRTPLTIIKGNLQMLKQLPLSSEGEGYAEVCLKKTDELKAMADDFFDMMALESSDAPVKLEQLNLTAAVMEFIAENESVISSAGFIPEIKLPEKSVFVYADEKMLPRMFGNLLGNILKYAENSFAVAVDEKGEAVFSNKLSSSYIPDLEHIFDRTYRGDKSRSGKGTGLGLYIVKLLSEKQGARAEASFENNVLSIKLIFRQK